MGLTYMYQRMLQKEQKAQETILYKKKRFGLGCIVVNLL